MAKKDAGECVKVFGLLNCALVRVEREENGWFPLWKNMWSGRRMGVGWLGSSGFYSTY